MSSGSDEAFQEAPLKMAMKSKAAATLLEMEME